MLVSIAACYAVYSAVRLPSGNSAFTEFFAMSTRAPTLYEVVKNLALVEFSANGVTWTIQIEAAGSLALPCLLMLGRRSSAAKIIILAALIALSAAFSFPWPLRFMFCFYVGSILGNVRVPAERCRVLFWTGAAVIFFGAHEIRGINLSADLPHAIGGAMIVAAVINNPSGAYARFLDARTVRFLGRISFSFYLLHFVALYICAEIAVLAGLPGTFGLPLNVAVTLASIALAAAGAAISYRLVERPSIAAGRQTAAIFAPPGTPRAINSAS
jgi:peptidoglycan/LPS O-acetylase OafA/YrhL